MFPIKGMLEAHIGVNTIFFFQVISRNSWINIHVSEAPPLLLNIERRNLRMKPNFSKLEVYPPESEVEVK